MQTNQPTCPTCGGHLLRLVVGNIIDFRHSIQIGGATCPAR